MLITRELYHHQALIGDPPFHGADSELWDNTALQGMALNFLQRQKPFCSLSQGSFFYLDCVQFLREELLTGVQSRSGTIRKRQEDSVGAFHSVVTTLRLVLRKRGLKVSTKTLEGFVKEIDRIAPWFACSGSLTIPSWEKLGGRFSWGAGERQT